MWYAKFYKKEVNAYKDINFRIIIPNNVSESDNITYIQNKLTKLLIEELAITHFRIYVVLTPNTEGIPQTKYIAV